MDNVRTLQKMNIVWCNLKIVVKSFFLKELYCQINSKLNWTVCVYWLKYSRYPSERRRLRTECTWRWRHVRTRRGRLGTRLTNCTTITTITTIHTSPPPNRLCIKVGRGQGDGDIGTRVWGLGTWGRETRDLGTSSMGRGDVWDGDEGTSNTGTQGTRDVNNYCKSRK